jgi:hypothetical protein
MIARHRLATACLSILLGSIGSAQQAPSATVTPGEFIVEPPTLINLGFEWLVDGDANRNAKVDVSYRKVGDAVWKIGMPLLRLQGERVTQPNVFALVSPNMFAGSILDLEADTAYEARFVMTDPDGVSGPAANATKTVTVRTRPEPMPWKGSPSEASAKEGRVYHVYPRRGAPERQRRFRGKGAGSRRARNRSTAADLRPARPRPTVLDV